MVGNFSVDNKLKSKSFENAREAKIGGETPFGHTHSCAVQYYAHDRSRYYRSYYRAGKDVEDI